MQKEGFKAGKGVHIMWLETSCALAHVPDYYYCAYHTVNLVNHAGYLS